MNNILLKFNKKKSILLIILIFIFISCAQTKYYEPEGFDNLLDEIEKQTEYFYKGEIFSYTPTGQFIQIYIKKDISNDEIDKIKELIITYVQSEQFRSFLESCGSIYYDDSFAITLIIKIKSKNFYFTSHKKTDFKVWY